MAMEDSREDAARPIEAERVPSAATPATSAPVESLREQADRLGVLDPLDVEPAHIYVPEEWAT